MDGFALTTAPLASCYRVLPPRYLLASRPGSGRPEARAVKRRVFAALSSAAEAVRGFKPNKFFGPHLGLAAVRTDLAAQWRTYKVRPAMHPFETGTLPHELLAGFVSAVDYVDSIGWAAIQAHERALGERFLEHLPVHCTLYGLPTMDGRVPTFAFTVDGHSPRSVAEHLAKRDIACWNGDYFAVEIMRRFGLGEEGTVRVGFIHYNTVDEVDRLHDALTELG